MDIFQIIADEVQKGHSEAVINKVKEALSQNIFAGEILNSGLVEGMNIVSEKYKNNEIFIPEVLVSARAMNAGLAVLEPFLAEANVQAKGKVVIGTARGDLHDIGKNIVGMLLKGAGFKIIDLGTDVSKEKFLEAAKKEDADIIGVSALLTTTMVYMREVIEAVKQAGLSKDIKIMIGGAPVTQAYADEIHADGYAPDASTAVDLAMGLLRNSNTS